MALMQWNEGLSVHISSIDHQHQKLVGIINRLHDAMLAGQAGTELTPVVNELVDYTRTHFSNEERLFIQHGYPDTEKHKAAHAAFIRHLREIQNSMAGGNQAGVAMKTMQLLKEWLTRHIKGTDQEYSGFMLERGVQ